MVDHLGTKRAYVTVAADDDHVSRFCLQGIDEHPERLDEVVSEIAEEEYDAQRLKSLQSHTEKGQTHG